MYFFLVIISFLFSKSKTFCSFFLKVFHSAALFIAVLLFSDFCFFLSLLLLCLDALCLLVIHHRRQGKTALPVVWVLFPLSVVKMKHFAFAFLLWFSYLCVCVCVICKSFSSINNRGEKTKTKLPFPRCRNRACSPLTLWIIWGR